MLCKAAVLERGHLSRDRSKGGRELCLFLGDVRLLQGAGAKAHGGNVLVMFMEQEGN